MTEVYEIHTDKSEEEQGYDDQDLFDDLPYEFKNRFDVPLFTDDANNENNSPIQEADIKSNKNPNDKTPNNK